MVTLPVFIRKLRNQKKIIFIVGPTAVGKTDIAFLLAKKINGEIVSCDSMQVYKELSIASNKPPRETLKNISHHLINVVSVAKNFDVAAFRKRALAAIKKIHQKNKIPLIVGGSGLYMAILLDGIFTQAKKNLRLRQKLENEARAKGSQFLYEKLQSVDPAAAAKIHANDTRRIVRALEVFLSTKKPISQLQKERQGIWGCYDIKIFALSRERSELYEAINARVEAMFTQGLVEEIKKISKKRLSKTAQGILGIAEVQGFLKGEYDLERAKYLLKLKTRHYAKRQLTWFKRDKRLQWVNMAQGQTPADIVPKILKES